MASADKAKKLTQFTEWVAAHVKGDEKGEAQIFLDRLFQAFGHAGLKEAGADCEERIADVHGSTNLAVLGISHMDDAEHQKRADDCQADHDVQQNHPDVEIVLIRAPCPPLHCRDAGEVETVGTDQCQQRKHDVEHDSQPRTDGFLHHRFRSRRNDRRVRLRCLSR